MRRVAPVLLALLLAGCAELFEFNLFQNLDPIRLPDSASLAEMEDEEGIGGVLDYLDEELSSDAFITGLQEDPPAAGAVESYLANRMASAADPADRLRAAVLYADFNLKMNGGEDLVNRSMAALLDGRFDETDFAAPADVVQLLANLLPSLAQMPAMESEAAFNAMLDGFEEAWSAYEAFEPSYLDPPPDGINLGDVAQKALVACLVHEAINSLYTTPGEGREALWDIARGLTPPDPPKGLDFYDDGAGVFSSASLGAIFAAAGLEPARFL